jgi:hypothetical protein
VQASSFITEDVLTANDEDSHPPDASPCIQAPYLNTFKRVSQYSPQSAQHSSTFTITHCIGGAEPALLLPFLKTLPFISIIFFSPMTFFLL